MSITTQEMFRSEISRYGMALYPITCKNDLDLSVYNVTENEDTIAITLPQITPKQAIECANNFIFSRLSIDNTPITIDFTEKVVLNRNDGSVLFDWKCINELYSWLERFTITVSYEL